MVKTDVRHRCDGETERLQPRHVLTDRSMRRRHIDEPIGARDEGDDIVDVVVIPVTPEPRLIGRLGEDERCQGHGQTHKNQTEETRPHPHGAS